MLRGIAFFVLLGIVLSACGGSDGQAAKAVEVAKACIEAKGYRVSTDQDDRVVILPSTHPEGFTIFFPSGRVADVAFRRTEPFPGDDVTLPATLGGYSASQQELNSVESAAIKDCNQKALDEVRK